MESEKLPTENYRQNAPAFRTTGNCFGSDLRMEQTKNDEVALMSQSNYVALLTLIILFFNTARRAMLIMTRRISIATEG